MSNHKVLARTLRAFRFSKTEDHRLVRAAWAGLEALEARRLLAVVINEIIASNDDGLVDEDGANSDWIELYNTGPEDVNLDGWFLTDNASNLTKWQFPSTPLPAGGYLVVFASDKNRAIAGHELHTNFALSANGEFLGLVRPDGTTIESSFTPFPAQHEDVSYGTGATTATTTNVTLVGDSTPLAVFAPDSADAARDDHWREIGFNDSGWLTGAGSVGWDTNGTAPNLLPFINRVLTTSTTNATEVNTNSNFSIYVRYKFNVADPAQLTSLQLNLRFDDGFIAYLNGKQLTRVNFAEDFVRTQPAWNSYAGNQTTGSTAGAANRINEADDLVTWDLTPFLPELVNGENVLAFHGVNSNSSSSSNTNRLDFLIDAELTATRATGTAPNTFMSWPTPGSPNGVGTLGLVEDVLFSMNRGVYNSPQSVALTTSTPDAIIRYTTDGSVPTETNGTVYTGPLNITLNTTLRATAFKTGWTPSKVGVQTYIFLDDVLTQSAADVTLPYAPWGHDKDDADSASGYNLDDESDWEMDPEIVNADPQAMRDALLAIPSMSLVMNWDDLFSGAPEPGTFPAGSEAGPQPQGIYIMGRSRERHTSIEYINPAQPGNTFQVNAAIEIQGHSSATRWNSDKLSFQITFKAPFGDKSLNFPLFAGTPDGDNAATHFNGFILDAMFNYTWHHANPAQHQVARFVTDQVVSDLQNLASSGDAPHGRFVHLYLNGLYWGLYNVHERPDDGFAEEYYDGDKDDYYVVKHANNDIEHEFTWVEGGMTAELAFVDLLNATRAVQQSPVNAALYNAVKQVLDVDQFIDYMIVHYYGANQSDWSHNNWYATFNHVDVNGKWRFHAWDQEHAFPPNGQNLDLTPKDEFETPTEIFQNLIDNVEFRLRFADRVQQLLRNDGLLTPANARAVYEARTNEIDLAILGESARWGDNRISADPYTRADFLAVKNTVLNEFFPTRTTNLLAHFSGAGWLPTLAAPTFSNYGGSVSAGTTLTISKPAGSPGGAVIYYTTDGSDPRPASGIPDDGISHSTGPIDLPLNASTRIRARIYFNNSGTANDWSPLIDVTFLVSGSYPVRITELNYHPPDYPGVADNEDAEFFELLNTGTSAVDLEGLQIGGFSSTPYVFGPGLTLGAGERIIVSRNPAVFQQIYGSGFNVAPNGYGTQNLSNSGEQVILISPFGDILQSFTYTDDPPWPTAPDGDGPSLEIIDPLGDPTDPANWRASFGDGGSPGSDGSLVATDANPIAVIVQFPIDVTGLIDADDLHITPAGGGSAVTPTSIVVDGPGKSARFNLSSALADGHYLGSFLRNGSIHAFSFSVLAADANDDGHVNTVDFNILAANFNQNAGMSYATGDFNGDGVVNAMDFNILATKFGAELPLPAPLPAMAGISMAAPAQTANLFSKSRIHESDPLDVLST